MHQDAGATLNRARILSCFGGVALLCSAAVAMPAPAPVPEDIPVAMMVDLSTGQTLYAREVDRRFVPASVVKVMTAFTTFRLIDEGDISPTTPVVISQELEDEWSGEGSTMFLKAGERPTFGQLLLGATTVSGNDASVAIAIAATGSVENWLTLMNENAAYLGMRQTHFGSANGYPDEGRTFTNARDLALLGQAITTRYPELYARYFGHRQLTWQGITQQNHDPLTGRVAGADGLKTGFTNEAGFTFLGSGERNRRRLVLVLAGAPDTDVRDITARRFLEWGFTNFQTQKLVDGGVNLGQARVQEGATDSVSLQTADDVLISLPTDESAELGYQIIYQGPIRAPIREGTPIARLRVTIAGQQPLDLPLVAANDVPEANFWQRLRNGLTGLFG